MVLFTNHIKLYEIQKYISNFPELFRVPIPQSWKENRDLTQKQFHKILEGGFITINDYTKGDNLWALTEILHYINPSLAIKLGVDIILFGGALYFLGTKKHSQILDEVIKGKKFGCFSMTEIGHGSNVKGLKTTAKKVGNKIIINTPDDEAVKCWIGGATTADYTALFCQLYDDKEVHQGLHAILVPLNLSGIERMDMRAKIGLNGVDNGFIRFTNVEVPLDNLLDAFGGFNNDGNYESHIKNKDIRFGKMLSALSIGRISIALGSYAIAYKAFIIALKYNLQRRQFIFKGDKEERRIIEYNTQLSKFASIYSYLYHMRLGILDLIEMYIKNGIDKKLHAISSLLKVFNTWKGFEITNNCREMCGGHGYLWENGLGVLMNDINIYQTFEGDNTVLIQQGVKYILDQFKHNKLTGIAKIINPNSSNLQYKVNLQIGELAFNLMNSKNTGDCWLDNLQGIISLGLDYTYLHLLQLYGKKDNEIKRGRDRQKNIIWKKIFSTQSRIGQNIIPSQIIKYLIEEKVFENIVKEWDVIHSERTDFIPICKYPDYLRSLL